MVGQFVTEEEGWVYFLVEGARGRMRANHH